MKPQIKYIELKSGYSDNGPAWIGLVTFSKTGRTIYFNGKALKNLKAQGISGNYYDMETGDEYWISGVKKNGFDRHTFGSGKIAVDSRIVNEYLTIINRSELDSSKYTITDVITNDVKKQTYLIENELEEEEIFKNEILLKNPIELSNSELEAGINHLIESEVNARYNKGRRSYKEIRILFEKELTKRAEE
ncbi:hypothetical protein [Flavobacterium beibuense]|uniref:Mannose-1-phosphate guanylyltransferase n=1 Tax=Flavobacterium beibuense TaxID=657326 RepID=A0A444W6L3_9FLAO|nr:hypothetical protein [Flavobacterium beibuense]RYJ41318.1 mannose-1-phosphate guanylyltransferase [Flavobacterium beibuense]